MNSLLISGVNNAAFPEVTPVSTDTFQVTIPSTPAQETITVPAGANFVKFSGSADFWATFQNSNVVVPTDSGTAASSHSVMNPVAKHVRNVSKIKINAKGLCHISLEFFA